MMFGPSEKGPFRPALTMKRKEKIFTGDFFLLFVIALLVYLSMNVLNVVIPLYVTEELQGSAALAGAMTTIYEIASCGTRPVYGLLTDRRGRRVIMVIGCGIFAAGCLCCGAIPTVTAAIIGRALMGSGFAGASTATNTASTDVIPSSRLQEGVGYFGISQALGSAFGSILASIFVVSLTSQSSILLVAGICGLSLVVSCFSGYEKRLGRSVSQSQRSSGRQGAFFEKSALLPSAFEFVSVFLISCPMCFMTLYIVSLGIPRQISGYFFAIAFTVIVLLRTFGSRLLKGRRLTVFLLPSYAALFLTALLLTCVHSAVGILCISVLYGAAHGGTWMSLGAVAVMKCSSERRGAANATFFFAFDSAISVGALFWGGVIDRAGYDLCFYLIAASCVILSIISYVVFHRQEAGSVA